jgi:hypothetical protein
VEAIHISTAFGSIFKKETLSQHIFYACPTISHPPGTFGRAQQSVIRRVPASIDSAEGHLGICFEL